MQYKESEGITVNRTVNALSYKYVILKPKGGELLALVSNTIFHEYHANAVQAFMEENEIDEVKISGGGKVISSEDTCKFFSSSGSFGACSVYDIAEVIKVFSNLSGIEKTKVSVEGHLGKRISEGGGKTYTLDDIKREVLLA